MNFRTPISIPKSNHPIDYYSKVVTMGSCFSENISAKFEQYKFQHYNNPFGILFQPDAIENVLLRAIEMRLFTEADLFFDNELWHCFEVHSELNNPDKADMLVNLNGILTYLNGQLQTCSHVIITLGTAWSYRFSHTQKRVANCHKIPQSNFTKELLSVEEITDSLHNIQTKLTEFNPEIKFIFTVSPVRHIKDGFVENQLSKAHLIAALHSSITHLSTSSYFPSYEIMMDDLRDYRFYAEDMLHPNQTAVDYIWKYFVESHISYHVFPIMTELESIHKGLNHRPFNPNTEQHLLFVQKLHERIEQLQEKYPFLQLT
ncbi:GSCFA domain-containing protein [Flavobacterium filum]|uniref:GSCFA domain-containing protein n=1 Tax=Flavobacterium TaxID=237 RepID=UPI0003FEEA00|nr:GSCFA domain-containing protein [Flavobacterium filum]